MKKDTIAFILSEIEKSLQNSDLKKQLYLLERKRVYIIKLIMTSTEHSDNLKRYYYLMEQKEIRHLTELEEKEYDKLYIEILNFED